MRYSMLWPEYKTRAMTFSYDDGPIFDRRLVDMFNRYGVKGTFNLNSSRFGCRNMVMRNGREVMRGCVDASEVNTLYQGHEVAVHTVNHPHLDELNTPQIIDEIIQDRRAFEAMVGYPVRGMALPYGGYNDSVVEVTRCCGIVYDRTTHTTDRFSIPSDPLRWACSCHHNGLEPLIEPFLKEGNDIRLLSVWGHSYEFEDHDSWDEFEAQIARLSGHEGIWYATNIEVFDYIAASRNLIMTVDKRIITNPSALTVYIKAEDQMVAIAPNQTITL